MANAFKEFYMRPNLASDGTVPSSGTLSDSPDIWIAQNQPVSNYLSVLATPESYATQSTKNILLNYDNYFYIRGKNGADTPVSKRIELYYAPCAVINWPSQWCNNQLKTAKGSTFVTVDDVISGQIAVGNECFIWPQVQRPPQGSDHYCMIANVNDAQNSHPIPGTQGMTYEDMADLIKNDLRYGWRNVVVVERNTPQWTFSQLLEIPEDVGETKTVRVSLICPTEFAGAAVQFTSSTSKGSSGPIELMKTVIPQTKGSAVLGVEVDLEPGFSCSVQVNYWSNGVVPPSGKSIKLDASYLPDTVEELKGAIDKNLICHNHAKLMNNFQGKSYTNEIKPYTPISLGSMIYNYK